MKIIQNSIRFVLNVSAFNYTDSMKKRNEYFLQAITEKLKVQIGQSLLLKDAPKPHTNEN